MKTIRFIIDIAIAIFFGALAVYWFLAVSFHVFLGVKG